MQIPNPIKAIGRQITLARDGRAVRQAFIERMYGTNVFGGFFKTADGYDHPDDLVRAKGLALLRTMVDRDDMVAAAYAYLQMAALSTGSHVIPASEDEPDKEPADYVEHSIERMKGSTTQNWLNVMDAICMGFSVCESIWGDPETEGIWKNKQGIYRLAHKNPVYFKFDLDPFGQIKDDGLWQQTESNDYNHFSLKDVVYWAFDPKDDNPYGRSPSRRAYRWYFMKDGVVKLWARYIERFGMPIALGKYDKRPHTDDRGKLLAFLKELRSSLSGAHPKEWEIDLIQPNHIMQGNLYTSALTACNRAIGRSVFLPALVMEQETKTGSYALGKSHNDQFVWILNFIRDCLEDVINEQIVRPIVEHNFGPSVGMPTWKLLPFAEEDMAAKAGVMKILSEVGLPLSVKYLSDEFSIPIPDEDEEVVSPKPASSPGIGAIEEQGGYRMPGMGEEEAREVTEIAIAASEGKLRPERTYYNMGSPAKVESMNPRERRIDFAGINREEDLDLDFAANNFAVIFESAAAQVEEQAGKGNGDRPLR